MSAPLTVTVDGVTWTSTDEGANWSRSGHSTLGDIAPLVRRIAALEAELAEARGELVGKGRCGAFGTSTGSQCIRENDHGGEHVLESVLSKLAAFRALTERAVRRRALRDHPLDDAVACCMICDDLAKLHGEGQP